MIAPDPGALPRRLDRGALAERPRAIPALELDYEAGGAYAATDGEGAIAIRVDGEPRDPIEVTRPGLQELTAHERTERHALRLEPSPGLLVYSIQFAAGGPR